MKKVLTQPTQATSITARELRICHQVLNGSLSLETANLTPPLIELIEKVLNYKG